MPFFEARQARYFMKHAKHASMPFSWLSKYVLSVNFKNLPFWDDSGLNARYLWIFQVDHTFYKIYMKILAASNEIRCVRYPWLPFSSRAVDLRQRKHLLFWL